MRALRTASDDPRAEAVGSGCSATVNQHSTGAAGRMDPTWNDSQPIYRQLRDKVVAMILEGHLADGDALPSVRSVAAGFTLNPLTVLKGYQQLVDEGLVEKRRGRGMFVTEGARTQLMRGERERFLDQEWPRVLLVIERLGLDPAELLQAVSQARKTRA